MHPLTSQMVAERRRALAEMAASGRRREVARRRPVARRLGLLLIRAGQRLAGPEELRRLPPGARSVLRLYR